MMLHESFRTRLFNQNFVGANIRVPSNRDEIKYHGYNM
jgi:hypothetical protein